MRSLTRASKLPCTALYRRCLRVAQCCIPEQRTNMGVYVRDRFRDPAVSHLRAHRDPELIARHLKDGNEECDRMVELLGKTKRLDAAGVQRMLLQVVPAQPHAQPTQVAPVAGLMREADVATWLTELGLQEHVAAFQRARVDGELLLALDGDDLLELGVESRVTRKRLLLRVEALRHIDQ